MTLSESTIEVQRVRLPNRTERVCKIAGFGVWEGLLFGSVFVTAGIALILVGLKILPVAPSSVYAPYWVLSVFGGVFAIAGVIAWIKVVREKLFVKRRKNLSALHPHSAVFADYPWNPKGITKSPWSKVQQSLASSLFFAAFLTPFNWWAWCSDSSSWLIGGIVSLFDLFLALAVIELIRRTLVALKYGKSGIEYETFPFTTGGRVNLRWFVPSGLTHAKSITFVLRCVEEWTEIKGAGDDKTISLIHEQLWAATRTTEGRVNIWPGARFSLSYDVPATAPESSLSGEPGITFWELDICATAAGVDFEERYLVPVYRGAFS
jgi:hypothetical protein